MNLLRRILRWFGIVEPPRAPYQRDARFADVLMDIIQKRGESHASIVAVETQRTAELLCKALKTFDIECVSVSSAGGLSLQEALRTMRDSPHSYRVYIMPRGLAATGWRVPMEYRRAWHMVTLHATFEARDPWLTQFLGRVSNAQETA